MIIGISGLIGSGKDTAADYLCNFHGYRRDSFAAALKDIISVLFGWDRDLLEGRTAESRRWREATDPWWSNRLGRNITPRWVLQYWGTEVCRVHFHDDIWIASLENKIRNINDSVVITDCRFMNELNSVKSSGGIIVRIKRGPDPIWFETAQTDKSKMPVLFPSIHASEYSWAAAKFDYVIDNNGTVEELHAQLKNLV